MNKVINVTPTKMDKAIETARVAALYVAAASLFMAVVVYWIFP